MPKQPMTKQQAFKGLYEYGKKFYAQFKEHFDGAMKTAPYGRSSLTGDASMDADIKAIQDRDKRVQGWFGN